MCPGDQVQLGDQVCVQMHDAGAGKLVQVQVRIQVGVHVYIRKFSSLFHKLHIKFTMAFLCPKCKSRSWHHSLFGSYFKQTRTIMSVKVSNCLQLSRCLLLSAVVYNWLDSLHLS